MDFTRASKQVPRSCPEPGATPSQMSSGSSRPSGLWQRKFAAENRCSWSSGRDTAPVKTPGSQQHICLPNWSRHFTIPSLVKCAWKRPESASLSYLSEELKFLFSANSRSKFVMTWFGLSSRPLQLTSEQHHSKYQTKTWRTLDLKVTSRGPSEQTAPSAASWRWPSACCWRSRPRSITKARRCLARWSVFELLLEKNIFKMRSEDLTTSNHTTASLEATKSIKSWPMFHLPACIRVCPIHSCETKQINII